MNFLSIFVLIPLLMLAGLWAARGIKAIRGVMVTGASALLIASVVLTFLYLGVWDEIAENAKAPADKGNIAKQAMRRWKRAGRNK